MRRHDKSMTYRGAKTLWHAERQNERLAALDSQKMRPLNAYRKRLQEASGSRIPNFDPFDGGVSARLLILLETPGPSAVDIDRRFVSIDNPTGTAKNLRSALAAASIPRKDIILWNTIPWVRASQRSITVSQRRAGIEQIIDLLSILPNLKAAILAGSVASAAGRALEDAGVKIILAPHPSPTLINTSSTLRDRLHAAFEAAAKTLDQSKMPNDLF